MMADGHLGKCKDCTRRDVTTNRAAKVDYYRAWDRARRPAKGRYTLTPEERRSHKRATTVVARALRAGVLVRPTECEWCGKEPGVNSRGATLIQAHHHDYAKPLDVFWFCPPCHVAADRLAGTRYGKVAA